MPRASAGIVLWRRRPGAPGVAVSFDVLLVHPGGPLWVKRDDGWWSIPKGEQETGEGELEAAEREFAEELGSPLPAGERFDLGEVRQRSSKRVHAWAVEGDLDPASILSGTFTIEWPPRSGNLQAFPEVDRAGWFSPADARRKMLPAQTPFLDRLQHRLTDADR